MENDGRDGHWRTLGPLLAEPTLAEAAESPGPLFATGDLILSSIPEAWSQSSGEGVSIGVIDTGRPDHADLRKAVIAHWPPVSPYDKNGHSTHVTGIIGARGKMTGVAPRCRIYSAKAIPCRTWDDIGRALNWCIECGVDIVNMSFGTTEPPPSYVMSVFDRAYEKGIFMCAGTGNVRVEGTDTIGWPARLPHVVPVAACGPNATEAPFSAEGDELDRGFSMPGEGVVSTWVQQQYARLSGTSMACPFVAGIAALVISKHKTTQGSTPIPDSGPERVKAVIEHLEHLTVRVGDSFKFGHGYLDASKL